MTFADLFDTWAALEDARTTPAEVRPPLQAIGERWDAAPLEAEAA